MFPAILHCGGTFSADQATFPNGSFENTAIEEENLTLTGQWNYSSTLISARYELGAAYSDTAKKAVIFGGRRGTLSETIVSTDTWVLEQSQEWVEKSPSVSPQGRYGHELVWIGDKFLLFGGINASGQCLNDSWLYDVQSNSWTYIVTPSSPEPRALFTLSYDSDQNKVVLFGGMGENFELAPFGTWVFDVSSLIWSKVTPDPSPPDRKGAVAAYDKASHRIILFGGETQDWEGSYKLNDTWAYDTPSSSWEEKNPGDPPSARVESSMLYDQDNGKVVIYSGENAPNLWVGDCHFFDYAHNQWKRWYSPSLPQGRYGHKMFYNSETKEGKIIAGRRNVETNLLYTYTIRSTGTWISPICHISGSTFLDWIELSVEVSESSLSALTIAKIQMASSPDGVQFSDFVGPAGTTDSYHVFTSTHPQSIWTGIDDNRYIRLKVNLVSTDMPNRPKIQRINLSYNQAPTSTELNFPLNGARLNTLRPFFDWDLAADNDGLNDYPLLYQIQVDDSENFSNPEISEENIPQSGSGVEFDSTADLFQGTFFWRTRAKDKGGLYGNWSSTFTLSIDTTTPPTPVTQISGFTGPGTGEITLSWVFPGDDDGRLDEGVMLVRYSTSGTITDEPSWTNASGEWTSSFSGDPGQSLNSIVTGLADGTTYYFAIKTQDECGNISSVSSTSARVSTNGLPLPVTSIVAARGPLDREIALAWIFPGDDQGRINNGVVMVRFSTGGPILNETSWATASGEWAASFSANPGDTVTNVVTGLNPCTTYFFSIKIQDDMGGRSNVSLISPFAKTNSAPFPVTHLTVHKGFSPGEIVLSWTYPGDEDGPIEFGIADVRASTLGAIADTAAWNGASHMWLSTFNAIVNYEKIASLTGLLDATTYYFAIKIRDEEGAWSSLSTQSPCAQTNAPPNITLTFPNGGEEFSESLTIIWTATDPNPEDNLTINLKLSMDEGINYPTVIASGISGTTTSYTWITVGVPNGSKYRILAEAVDLGGLSASDSSDGNVHRINYSRQPFVVFASTPADGQILSGIHPIQWDVLNDSPYITYSFILALSPDSGQSFSTLMSTPGFEYSFDTKKWKDGCRYRLKVNATDSGDPYLIGEAQSGIFCISNSTAPDPFSLIWPLENDYPSMFDLTFEWEKANDKDGDEILYSFFLSTDPAFSGATEISDILQTSYTPLLGSLLMDTTYFWKVAASDPSHLTSTSSAGQFILSSSKARTRDRLLLVEILGDVPVGGNIAFENAFTTHGSILERANTKTKADRFISSFSLPVWRFVLKDSEAQPLLQNIVKTRLTFSPLQSNLLPPTLAKSELTQNFKIARLDESRECWQLVPTQENWAAQSESLSTFAGDFSIFTVVGAQTPSKALSGVTSYPNPFSPNREVTYFNYVLTEDSNVTIRIYTLLGDFVRILRFPSGSIGGTGSPLGLINEVPWDGKNESGNIVGSGMYVAEIHAESPSGASKELKRIGVLK